MRGFNGRIVNEVVIEQMQEKNQVHVFLYVD